MSHSLAVAYDPIARVRRAHFPFADSAKGKRSLFCST
jgi:hypothetical protein